MFGPDDDGPEAIAARAATKGIQRIHMLAWRDLDDPDAGGSELHASTVAAHWAAAGLEVTLRTSSAPGHRPEAERNGYRVVRRGGRYGVFPRTVASEIFGRLGPRDALVEIWNGVPFLSPLWARRPRMTWIHHVHEDMWPQVLPFPLAQMGQVMERRFAPPLYRRTPIVTLSESSKAHIVDRMRLSPAQIEVVPPGIDSSFVPGTRAVDPLVLAVGRLMPPKDFPRLFAAMQRVRETVPTARLMIVGEGPERRSLEALIQDANAADWCELPGRLSDDALRHAYQQAWVLSSVSTAEGWGMTITEAAACATPAVATRIPGHCDAVEHEVTGVLVDRDDELVSGIARLLEDPALRDRMGQAAYRRSADYSWARTARRTLDVLVGSVS